MVIPMKQLEDTVSLGCLPKSGNNNNNKKRTKQQFYVKVVCMDSKAE
jgi:hypothetical protein